MDTYASVIQTHCGDVVLHHTSRRPSRGGEVQEKGEGEVQGYHCLGMTNQFFKRWGSVPSYSMVVYAVRVVDTTSNDTWTTSVGS